MNCFLYTPLFFFRPNNVVDNFLLSTKSSTHFEPWFYHFSKGYAHCPQSYPQKQRLLPTFTFFTKFNSQK